MKTSGRSVERRRPTVMNVERNKIDVVIFTNLRFISNKVKGRFSWEEYCIKPRP